MSKYIFNCPHCNKEHIDEDYKYLERCSKNKSNCTTIKCECKKFFYLAYDYTGQAVAFIKREKRYEV